MKHFVYALTDPDSHNWRYVGITMEPKRRLSVHLAHAKSRKNGEWRDHGQKAQWIRSLLDAGQRPDMVILAETSSAAESAAIEVRLISQHGDGLLNANGGGGQGRPAHLSWLHFDERHAALVTAAFLNGDPGVVANAVDICVLDQKGWSIRAFAENHMPRFGAPVDSVDRFVIDYGFACLPDKAFKQNPDLWDAVRAVHQAAA